MTWGAAAHVRRRAGRARVPQPRSPALLFLFGVRTTLAKRPPRRCRHDTDTGVGTTFLERRCAHSWTKACTGAPLTIAGMADYTVKNLKNDIEDAAPKFGFSPQLEAHFASGELGCEQGGLSYQRLAPDTRMPFGHKQGKQEELYVIVAGGGRMKLDDDVIDVKQWDAVRVPPQVTRSFDAGPDGLELIAFGAPQTGPGDAEIIAGWW